jgi:uncharacterized membrane protein
MSLLLGLVLGMSAGMRSMTPIAVVAWAAQLGWPDLGATRLGFMTSPITAWAFTLFACTELVFDKLPFTPSRLAAGPLGARIVSGALCAATVFAATHQPVAVGAIAGMVGAVIGAVAGYHARRHLTMNRKAPDLVVALVEDAIAIGLAVLAVTRI